jgi:uncharacterized lipoprotein YbaY
MVWRAMSFFVVWLALSQPLFPQGDHDVSIKGDIVYLGFDALPRGSKIHVYLREASVESSSKTVAEKTFLTEGQQIPIKFSLSVSQTAILPKIRYSVCAEIFILDRRAFDCDKPILFIGSRLPKSVTLNLRRLP